MSIPPAPSPSISTPNAAALVDLLTSKFQTSRKIPPKQTDRVCPLVQSESLRTSIDSETQAREMTFVRALLFRGESNYCRRGHSLLMAVEIRVFPAVDAFRQEPGTILAAAANIPVGVPLGPRNFYLRDPVFSLSQTSS